jgi:hypothetical protein
MKDVETIENFLLEYLLEANDLFIKEEESLQLMEHL